MLIDSLDGGFGLLSVPMPLLVSTLGVVWGLLAAALVFVCILLVMVILLQDPKGGGLSSAFGAGPGGESVFGAQAQRGVTRFTGILTTIFMVLVTLLVIIDNGWLKRTSAGYDGSGGAETPPATAPADGTTPTTPLDAGSTDVDGTSPLFPPAGTGSGTPPTGETPTSPGPTSGGPTETPTDG